VHGATAEDQKQARLLRYQADSNAAKASQQIAGIVKRYPNLDPKIAKQQLERALGFADDAAKPRCPPSLSSETPPDDGVVRNDGVFVRGKIRNMLGDLDGAKADLERVLKAYSDAGGSAEAVKKKGQVLKEMVTLRENFHKHAARERAIYGGWAL
jgi:hypothetical protein